MPNLIDALIPRAEIAERHETVVAAAADLVFEVATEMDLRSIPLVGAIFWLREKLSAQHHRLHSGPRALSPRRSPTRSPSGDNRAHTYDS